MCHYLSSAIRSYITGISYKYKRQENERFLVVVIDFPYLKISVNQLQLILYSIRLNAALQNMRSSRLLLMIFQTTFNLAFATFYMSVNSYTCLLSIHVGVKFILAMKKISSLLLKKNETDPKERSTTLGVDSCGYKWIKDDLSKFKGAFLQHRPWNDGLRIL